MDFRIFYFLGFFGFFGFYAPGLVPLDARRDSVLNGGRITSGAFIWTPFVPKMFFPKSMY